MLLHNRNDVAAQVFKSKSFVNRLGSKHGLKLLGMHEEGIIWNNNTTGWQEKRKYFADCTSLSTGGSSA